MEDHRIVKVDFIAGGSCYYECKACTGNKRSTYHSHGFSSDLRVGKRSHRESHCLVNTSSYWLVVNKTTPVFDKGFDPNQLKNYRMLHKYCITCNNRGMEYCSDGVYMPCSVCWRGEHNYWFSDE